MGKWVIKMGGEFSSLREYMTVVAVEECCGHFPTLVGMVTWTEKMDKALKVRRKIRSRASSDVGMR